MLGTCAEELKGWISYPCHEKHKAMVFKGAHGLASYECPQCHNMAIFDFDNMTARPSKMIRGATRKFMKK